MNGNGLHLTLEEWLRDAYAGCPPAESFLEAEAGALDPEARRRLEEHADGCPACAAERDLVRLFEAGEEGGGVRPEDLAFVVGRLEAAAPVKPAARPDRKVLPFPAARRRPAAWITRLAAAAVVILAAGLFWQRFIAAPPLPAPPASGGVVRGGEVEVLSPLGDVAAAPAELRWEPRPGAASYKVRLLAVDDTVLWEATVLASLAPSARLPAKVAQSLQPAVSYVWSVEALDAQGARLGGSEPARFRVRPL
jgi:Putative zinc-finger